MKRNFTDSSTRTTAGCLPVPLFNQKKRTRQPLTSNPLKNESSTSNAADTLDLSTMLADFGWEAAKPEPTQLQKTTGVEFFFAARYRTSGTDRGRKAPSYQIRLKEKDNSLRILSAVIESMKHWSQYTNKAPLLFEVLGILDSAVTPGLYGAKTFLLRDGKESVSCVFYEIDRELPRLIRGRAHRCVGNYDTSRKLFRCVSVRPASVPEQQTFQDFVRIADVEMREYVKASNEV
ncbi:PREDICTED: spermatogenesis-associated protein 22 [Gekko japonicus]|uniref:Spermatogenesis-associated protein 22 n=1 Tax=Gekko japonicus TaxID=146911 RepID=A0ABM1JLM4_GEKJA|nr:PREDICTED: spermatogenesis-associated protein 22 [Gekko japonicus]